MSNDAVDSLLQLAAQNLGPVIWFALASVLTVAPIIVAFNVYRCRSWPNTEGVIVKSERLQDDDWEFGKSWSAKIKYEYSVDEVVFHSKQIGFGGGEKVFTNLPGAWTDALEKYPVGTNVTVYFDPKRPQHAVLERGYPWLVPICFIVGVLMFSAIQ